MPRVSAGKRDQLVVAIDSGLFIEPNGTEHLVRVGTRLRATHPAVRLSPASFVAAGLPDDEIALARRALYEAHGIYGRD